MRHGRALVAGALLLLAALGWLYLVYAPMPMPGAAGVAGPAYLALSFVMWTVMMVAMMTPAVAPVVLLFDRAVHGDGPGPHWRTAAFLGGYLLAWTAFSLVATAAQAALVGAGVVDAMGTARSRFTSGALLLAVALYQWSPLKAACLERCESPLALITRRRRGALRDLRAGLAHGSWCVGCCVVLMLLLFVGGVMNLAWVAVITAVVSAERLLPNPQLARQVLGGCALVTAIGFLVAGWGQI